MHGPLSKLHACMRVLLAGTCPALWAASVSFKLQARETHLPSTGAGLTDFLGWMDLMPIVRDSYGQGFPVLRMVSEGLHDDARLKTALQPSLEQDGSDGFQSESQHGCRSGLDPACTKAAGVCYYLYPLVCVSRLRLRNVWGHAVRAFPHVEHGDDAWVLPVRR